MMREGLVIRATGSWYDVLDGDTVIECRIRGRLRLRGVRSTNPVVVGDRVVIEPNEAGEWAICDIKPRQNYIIRRASNLSKESHIIAANIDLAMVVVTLQEPATPLEFLDRFLVTCEAYKIPATILLAKIDLMEDCRDQVEEFRRIYEAADYEVIEIAALTGEGVEEVVSRMKGRTTLLSGNSGVGKSTLIRAIDPTANVRTGAISESFHKGKHTTTYSTLYRIEGIGSVIDTPGIKGFGLIDIENSELWHYFPEMLRSAGECRFYNCTHLHEPGCAVQAAVERGEIAFSRYESYLKIMDEDDKYRK